MYIYICIYIHIYIYKLFKSLREIAVPQGDPAEQVPEVGGIFWQHPGAPDKPR